MARLFLAAIASGFVDGGRLLGVIDDGRNMLIGWKEVLCKLLISMVANENITYTEYSALEQHS